MGKPERKSRERLYSSSSYFLRCFGISRKLHSNKAILDAGQEAQKKTTKTRIRWFLRPRNVRMKNGENTSETEKPNSVVEDDKQNLFRGYKVVEEDDQKNIATSGYKAFEHETKQDANKQRDINPDPLSFSGYDLCNKRVRGGKLDPTKTVGSGSKPKDVREKSSRVRNRSRVGRLDPVIGIIIIMVTLMIMLIWGRFCAILCTSTWCYFLPRLKEAATAVALAKRKRKNVEDGSYPSDMDLNSEAYKKKVVLDGFLFRQRRVSL